jgi:hypothetical protein
MQRWVRLSFLILLVGMLVAGRFAVAQGRLSDKDLQRLMQNLKDDAQPFRQSFANALKKSTIRKTSREKDARALAEPANHFAVGEAAHGITPDRTGIRHTRTLHRAASQCLGDPEHYWNLPECCGY